MRQQSRIRPRWGAGREVCFLCAVLMIGFAGPLAAGGPLSARQPVGADGRLQIGSGDRCPVCAMLPIRHPRFAAAIELKDGRTFYFCSTGCMLKSWLHPDIYLAVEASQLKRTVVLEYLSGKALDARSVFWVSGSDVVGPMGPALVPLEDENHLEAFRRRHGGKQIFRLDDLTDDTWEALTGKQATRH